MPLRGSPLFSNRVTRGIGGSERAAGGLLNQLPASLLARRNFSWQFNDFLSHDDFVTGGDAVDTLQWRVDAIGAPTNETHVLQNGPSGEVLLTAGDTDSTGFGMVRTGGTVEDAQTVWSGGDPEHNGKLYAWECRFKVDDITGGTVGIAVGSNAASAWLDTAGDLGVVIVGSGFRMQGGILDWVSSHNFGNVVSGANSVAGIEDDEWVRVGCRWMTSDVADPTANQWVEFYVNGVLRETLRDAVAGVVHTTVGLPALNIVNGAGGSRINMTVDYFLTTVER